MKKITDKIKKNIADWGATILGLLVTVAMAWQTVDWDHFNLNKDWIKLAMSAIPAIGGYVTKIKTKKDDSGKD